MKACVADTGLDTTQSDIAPNFVAGYDAFDPSKPTVDVNQLGVAATETHATHVSGIILGAINGSGIHGVAPQADLYEARVLGTQPDGVTVEGSTSQVMAGVQWLAGQGCKVINMKPRRRRQVAVRGGALQPDPEPRHADRRSFRQRLVQEGLVPGRVPERRHGRRRRPEQPVRVVLEHGRAARPRRSGRRQPLVLTASPESRCRGHPSARRPNVGVPAEFSGATDGVTGQFVDCGLGETADDCGTPPSGTWVAVIKRGSFSFAQKADSAMQAGASGVLLYNNTAVPVTPTLGTPDDDGTPWPPTIIISQADGQAIVAGLASTDTATLYNIATNWNLDSGTSMATPHVSGVAALIFGKNPNVTPDQVERIMERTATDLGVPNYDTTFGWGLVNAQAALAAVPSP